MRRMTTKRQAVLAGLALALAASGAIGAAGDPNNPTGTTGLILVDKVGRHIRFLDPATFKELSSFPAGVAPHDLAISPDHRTAYVPIYGDGVYGRNPSPGHEIAIIDLASRKQTGTIDVSPHQAPHGIQIDANGLLYVSCDLSRKLLVIDPKTRTIKAALDTEGTGHWAALLPDGTKAYVANKNDRLFVTVIDIKKQQIVARVPAPNGTQGIAASPDGTRVVAVDLAQPQLLVIDTSIDKVINTVALEGNSRASFKVRYTPDGSKLVAINLSLGLANIVDAKNLRGSQQILTVGKDPMGIAFSADGRNALIANHGDGTVSVIDLQQAKVTNTFKGGTGIEVLSYY
jgi:DNA-binding beta-propeller fold protein YncE